MSYICISINSMQCEMIVVIVFVIYWTNLATDTNEILNTFIFITEDMQCFYNCINKHLSPILLHSPITPKHLSPIPPNTPFPIHPPHPSTLPPSPNTPTTHQSLKRSLNILLLPLVALIERYFFRVGDEARVDIAEVTLQPLLGDSEAADGPAEVGEESAGY